MTVQQLQDKINANSAAWHQTEDESERARLHEENVSLYGKLDALSGSTSQFDSASGRWNSQEAGEGNYQGVEAPEVRDLSGLVVEKQSAANEQALLELSRAYENSKAQLTAQRDAIAGGYRAARDSVAAQNEIEKQNANTYAAAAGLNSGAAGQIALSQSVAQQNDLNQLYAQEAAATAETDAALSEMEREYNFAVAEAKAEGDRALADALYDELSRFDSAQRQSWKDSEEQSQSIYKLNRDNYQYDLQQQAQSQKDAYEQMWDQRKWDYQVSQDALKQQNTLWEQARSERNDAWSQARSERNDAWDHQSELASQAIQRQNAGTSSYNAYTSRLNTQLRIAQELANMGDFQGFEALGYSKSQIAGMEEMWKAYMNLK